MTNLASCTNKSSGFTSVELLIVIIVIGILAAIVGGSYAGIQLRATSAVLQADLNNVSKALRLDQILYGAYPNTLAEANGGKGITSNNGATLEYSISNDPNPIIFCISATKDGVSYNITQDGFISAGVCPVADLDASNPISYAGNGETWADLSGKDNNGTLVNGVKYKDENGGVLNFDGDNDYVRVEELSAYSVGMWVKPSSSQSDEFPTYYNQNKKEPTEGYWWVYSVGTSTNLNWQYSNGTATETVTWDNAITYNVWNYFVFIYNDSNKTVTLYKNGNNTGTKDCPGALLPSSTFFIGDYQGEIHGYNLKGLINGFRIYDKSLSRDEINEIFNVHRDRYDL